MTPSNDSIVIHGWSSVPRVPKVILDGKPYINKPASLLVKDLKFPSEDPLVTEVQRYAKEKLLPQTYSHSMRVYYFCTLSYGVSFILSSCMQHQGRCQHVSAVAILTQQFPDHAGSLNLSTLALTALLHDIGTTHDHMRATQLSFEFYGGILALDLVQKRLGAPQSQAEAVAEAIIRHQDLGATGRITLLGQLIQLATIYDNMGGNPEIIHADTRIDVNKAHPRNGWSRCFAETIREENRIKPWAHTTALGEEDFPNGVLNNQLMAEYDDWK